MLIDEPNIHEAPNGSVAGKDTVHQVAHAQNDTYTLANGMGNLPSASASFNNSVYLSREGHLTTEGRLRAAVREGLVGVEVAAGVDRDRLKEEVEDFLRADEDRLALKPEKLKPVCADVDGVVLRTIVGE